MAQNPTHRACEQVIGAAVKDPKVQAAALQAASHPSVQDAAWSNAAQAARFAAGQGCENARVGMLEVRSYIEESHCSVRVLCFSTALALLVSSFLGVINVFNAVFKPYQYLFAFWNILFAACIIVMDGKPEWSFIAGAQSWLFSNAAFLTMHLGRAAFYFYVGSINLLLLPDSFLWKLVYIMIGAALCFVGALMLLQHCGLCKQREPGSADARV